MDKFYNEFLQTIKLTEKQEEDGRTKYKGVCDCLARHYYGRSLSDADKILFGSFKTRTQVRPMGYGQDVDCVFKIPKEVYDKYKCNPSGILQKVRSVLDPIPQKLLMPGRGNFIPN